MHKNQTILFVAQTALLRPFYEVYLNLKNRGIISKAGLYVSGKQSFDELKLKYPEINADPNLKILKEWELIQKAKNTQIDINVVRNYDSKLGLGSLWASIFADRRIILGPVSTLQQQYSPRYDYETIKQILSYSVQELDRFIAQVNPSTIISFIAVTYGEYLVYKFAELYGIKYLNIRTSKVKNYITFADNIFDPIDKIVNDYNSKNYKPSDATIELAQSHILKIREKNASYEGVVHSSNKPKRYNKYKKNIGEYLHNFIKNLSYYLRNREKDNQLFSPISTLFYAVILQNIKAFLIKHYLNRRYINFKQLGSLTYTFFPLHTEPEVSLMVRAPHCINQIEIIRNISRSLPIDHVLLVKEHPVAIGKRSIKYYNKILEIPNVRLLDPKVSAQDAIAKSQLVATINSSIGMDALIVGKPVICFGNATYQVLPENMVRRIFNTESIAQDVAYILQKFHYNEDAITRLICATIDNSYPINFYSVILGKEGVYSEHNTNYSVELTNLSNFIASNIKNV